MANVYKTNLTVQGVAGVSEAIEIRLPEAASVFVRLVGMQVNADQFACTFKFRRYAGLPAHAESPSTPPTSVNLYKVNSVANPAPTVQVFTGTPSRNPDATGQIVWPSLASVNFEHTEMLVPNDSGDDKEVIFHKYNGVDYAPVINPNESMSIELPDADGVQFTIVLILEEVTIP